MKRNKEVLPSKLYIGIDNGVSGTIGWTNGLSLIGQIKTPVFSQLKYTKAKANITRINHTELKEILSSLKEQHKLCPIMAFVERPMVNPGRFNASISAVRALESLQIILEHLAIPYEFIDSKQWQKMMLPSGLKGSDVLKKASIDIGKRLFPQLNLKPDADGILIAEWARRSRL